MGKFLHVINEAKWTMTTIFNILRLSHVTSQSILTKGFDRS